MVKAIHKEALTRAIENAQAQTRAIVAASVAPMSEDYQGHVLLCGFLGSSAIALGIWTQTALPFPWLLAVQCAFLLLLDLMPPLRRVCLYFLPRSALHRHAARAAYAEYLRLHHHSPAGRPLVLLYVSLAERYAHVLHSRDLREKIPEATWTALLRDFTQDARQSHPLEAAGRTVTRIGELLAPYFPPA